MKHRDREQDAANGGVPSGSGPGDAAPWQPYSSEPRPLLGMLGQPGEGHKSVTHYLRCILARKWTVFLVFVLGIAISCLYLTRAKPYYVSRATVRIEKVYPRAGQMNEIIALLGQYELFYQTQIEALQSTGLAEAYLELTSKKSLGDEPVASEKSRDSSGKQKLASGDKGLAAKDQQEDLDVERMKAERVRQVLGRVSVKPRQGTQMLDVTMGARAPLKAKEDLETYLTAYIDLAGRQREEMTSTVRKWLDQELADAQKQLKDSETELINFTKKHRIVFREQNPNEMVSFFEKVGESLVQSKTQRVGLEASAKVKKNIGAPLAGEEEASKLRTRLEELQSRYKDMGGIYSPNFFKMKVLRQKIAEVQQQVSDMEQARLAEKLEAAKEKERMATALFDKTKQAAIEKNDLVVQYNILKKAVEANGKLYLMIWQKSKQAQLDQRTTAYNVFVSSRPTLPLVPERPKKQKILLLGAVLGLLLGVVLAISLESMDDTARDSQELQDRLSLPILGTVPKIEPLKKAVHSQLPNGAIEFVAHCVPSSPFAEAVRIVQNSASSLLAMKASPVICISSALPMEGKTLLAVAISTITAGEGRKVLIIDGDLRKPRIHQVFGDDTRFGLSDVLYNGSSQLKDAVRPSAVEGLFYMTSGTHSPNPAALLKSPIMHDVLNACKAVFDMVIIDAPPILGVVDARILAGLADGCIMIAKAGHTPMDLIREAKEALEPMSGRLLGVVLNMADERTGGSKYYYYKRYYSKHYYDKENMTDHT